MTTWLKSTFDFPKRIAYGMVSEELVSAGVRRYLGKNPGVMEEYFQALVRHCAQGKYAGATLHSMWVDVPHCLYLLLFSHPSLPLVVRQNDPIPSIDLFSA